jgi:YD repeat-containing protein
MGKAQLKFEEFTTEGVIKPEIDRTVNIPVEKRLNTLSFKLIDEADQASEQPLPQNTLFYDNVDTHLSNIFALSFLPLLYHKTDSPILRYTGDDPVLGEIGAIHNPWYDQGITPYGEYFENNQEYVSMHTGFLSIVSTDLSVPGRGMDLSINRVYAPPIAYEGETPASGPDYSYQNYPWTPMGNGWMLGYPWIELDQGSPAYIRFPGGQRYEWNGSSLTGKEYHSGDRFTLYGHANGNITLYTVDGTRYDFDSSYKPARISDPNHNEIVFHYTSNRITTITDTVGRNISLAYNGNNLLSSVTSGSNTIVYQYEAAGSGYHLSNVTDPIGRVTIYGYMNDYILDKVIYPTGGSTWYQYSIFDDSGYRKYRVSGQFKFPVDVPREYSEVVLDHVKNIEQVTELQEWGEVTAKNFNGIGVNRNTTEIQCGSFYSGPDLYIFSGYVEWDISKIPDTANMTSVKLGYHCTNNRDSTAGLNSITNRPSLANYSVIWDDLEDGSNYAPTGFPQEGTNRVTTLSSTVYSDIDNHLDDDWFALGIYWTGYGDGSYMFFDTSYAEPMPMLYLEYDNEVKAPVVEGASYTSYDFDSTFYTINNTVIKNSDGSQTQKTTKITYNQDVFTERAWNGTTGDALMYTKNTEIDDQKTRRRIRIEYYPGSSTKCVNQTTWYDNWGNNYYRKDYENHESYYSYSNTNSMNQYNSSSGTQVTIFTDSFYTNTLDPWIHNKLLGKAELSNGVGSPAVESYYRYDGSSNLVEAKSLLSSSWVNTSYSYDGYGNLVKVTDP